MNDAFGRLRTSNPYTLFEYYPNSGSENNDFDADAYLTKVQNGGSIAYNSDNTIELKTAEATADVVTRQTKLPMEYQPGKSRLIYMSAIPTTNTAATVRIGMFSVDVAVANHPPIEGHYFELSNNTLKWVYTYTDTDPPITDPPTANNTISQNSWNIDIFDGNGPSGITLDSDSMKTNMLFVIDQEWLGVGRTRVGFNIRGINYYAHEFIPDLDHPYTTSPRLPLVYQISATSTESTLKQICSTCISEGGFTPLGTKISISTGINPITITTAGTTGTTKYILMGLKLKDTSPKSILKLLTLDFTVTNNTYVNIELQLHSSGLGDQPIAETIDDVTIGAGTIGSITGTPEFNNIPKSNCLAYLGTGTLATIVKDGYILLTRTIEKKSQLVVNNNVYETLLTRSQISQYDTLYLVVYSTGDPKVIGCIDFIESN